MIVVGTAILTPIVVLAATLITVCRDEISRRHYEREWFLAISVAVFASVVFAIPALLVTLPISAWISGVWDWPLAHWPIWLQIGVITPLIMIISGGVLAILINEDYERFIDAAINMAFIGFISLITITPTTILATVIFSAPLHLQIVAGVIWAPYLLLILGGGIAAFIDEDIGETMVLSSFPWLFISMGTIGYILLVLTSLWFLFLTPVILIVLLLMFDSGEGGGGYDGRPLINWSIFS